MKHVINDDKFQINWVSNVFFNFLNSVCVFHGR
jgi:hypothetical protein